VASPSARGAVAASAHRKYFRFIATAGFREFFPERIAMTAVGAEMSCFNRFDGDANMGFAL
jgi:hypothetical protein